MRIAGLALEADLDRNLLEIFEGDAAGFDAGADALHIALADGEVHVDRLELDYGRKRRRTAGADELAQRDLART